MPDQNTAPFFCLDSIHQHGLWALKGSAKNSLNGRLSFFLLMATLYHVLIDFHHKIPWHPDTRVHGRLAWSPEFGIRILVPVQKALPKHTHTRPWIISSLWKHLDSRPCFLVPSAEMASTRDKLVIAKHCSLHPVLAASDIWLTCWGLADNMSCLAITDLYHYSYTHCYDAGKGTLSPAASFPPPV